MDHEAKHRLLPSRSHSRSHRHTAGPTDLETGRPAQESQPEGDYPKRVSNGN